MRRLEACTGALGIAAVLVLGGCGLIGGDSGGEVAAQGGATPDSVTPDLPDAAQGGGGNRPPEVIDRGEYSGNRKAETAARFYEELWEAYARGKVTRRLDRLMTGRAESEFQDTIAELARKGQVVHNLSQARVLRVKGSNVDICMAAVSAQVLDASTGLPVKKKAADGYIDYNVNLVKESGKWRVEQTRGYQQSACGEDRQ
ncbi:MAG: hypothetical protein GEU93_07390 [Propionibacteriales bacterium]|nr:hypothetical protein [Propionibacteriales bacterium]